MISGLVRGSRPALVLAVLVAVVGATGTAWAGHSNSGSNKDKQGTAAVADQGQKAQVADKSQNTSFGDKADSGDKSDRNGNTKKWKKHKKHGNGNGNDDRDYGVASVWVSRGGNPATAWATYSTLLGSPVGDTTGGVFRFTCATLNAPCTVAVKAAALSDSSDAVSVYPRVLIYRQDYDTGGPEVYCEYGDGSTGSLPLALTPQAPTSTPAWTAVQLNIGGSDDCGLAGPAGDVNQITVPAGYYDVKSTFAFLP